MDTAAPSVCNGRGFKYFPVLLRRHTGFSTVKLYVQRYAINFNFSHNIVCIRKLHLEVLPKRTLILSCRQSPLDKIQCNHAILATTESNVKDIYFMLVLDVGVVNFFTGSPTCFFYPGLGSFPTIAGISTKRRGAFFGSGSSTRISSGTVKRLPPFVFATSRPR